MDNDPIVEEIRSVREAHAAKFNYDLDAIVADLKRQERESGETHVSYPPKRIAPTGPAIMTVPKFEGSATQANP